MSARSKACDISARVRLRVTCRDNMECVICHRPGNLQVAHYIPRSQGGLGIEENLVLLCVECHQAYDNGDKRKESGEFIKRYLSWNYPDWDESKLKYDKWEVLNEQSGFDGAADR